jgi:hypothetical protein
MSGDEILLLQALHAVEVGESDRTVHKGVAPEHNTCGINNRWKNSKGFSITGTIGYHRIQAP